MSIFDTEQNLLIEVGNETISHYCLYVTRHNFFNTKQSVPKNHKKSKTKEGRVGCDGMSMHLESAQKWSGECGITVTDLGQIRLV